METQMIFENKLADPRHINNCALLSYDVYNPKDSEKSPMLTHWDRLLDYKPNPAMKNKPNDFLGRLYQNNCTKEHIVAFRGTDMTRKGDMAADFMIGLNKWSTYDSAAIAFYSEAYLYLSNHSITAYPDVTGHSLGGYLAQVVVDVNEALDITAVTFNAPGAAGLYIPDKNRLVHDDRPNILNLVGDLDIIHSFGGNLVGMVDIRPSQGSEADYLRERNRKILENGKYALPGAEYELAGNVALALFVEHSINSIDSKLTTINPSVEICDHASVTK